MRMKVVVNGKECERSIDHYERIEGYYGFLPVPVLRENEFITRAVDGKMYIFEDPHRSQDDPYGWVIPDSL